MVEGEVLEGREEPVAPPPTPRLRSLVLAFVAGGLAVLTLSAAGRFIGPTDGENGPVRACRQAVTDEVHRAVGLQDVDARRLGDDWLIDATADGRAWRCEVAGRRTTTGWDVVVSEV